jgi:hypothetical protein
MNKNITLKPSFHLLVFIVDAPMSKCHAEMLSLSIKKYESFLGEDPQTRPSYFAHKSLTCWGNGTQGKIGVSETPHKRLEWENLIFFAA